MYVSWLLEPLQYHNRCIANSPFHCPHRHHPSLYSSGFGSLSKDTVTGINILKTGQDPLIQPDSEYPDWLWDLTQRDPTIEELLRKHEQTGGGLSAEELKRYAKLLNRKKIKENNAKTSL